MLNWCFGRIHTTMPTELRARMAVRRLRLHEVRLQILVAPSLISKGFPVIVIARCACHLRSVMLEQVVESTANLEYRAVH